jgi:hypothetical protein
VVIDHWFLRRGEVKNIIVLLTHPQELSLIGTSHMTRARCHVTSNIYNNAILTIRVIVDFL